MILISHERDEASPVFVRQVTQAIAKPDPARLDRAFEDSPQNDAFRVGYSMNEGRLIHQNSKVKTREDDSPARRGKNPVGQRAMLITTMCESDVPHDQ